MAEVIPFRGILFDVPKISSSMGEDLLAPPYDVITPEFREELYDRNPYNIVRIDFGKELPGDNDQANKYIRARDHLDSWLSEHILTREAGPCFYSYEISYTIGSKAETLTGFLGLVRIEELGAGNIHPHECTHSKPKKDRLELMRLCSANISPIFSLYNGPEKMAVSVLRDLNRTAPYMEARDSDGAVHRLRVVRDPAAIEIIQSELADKAIFIADGHHRYETAFEYRNAMREEEGTSDGPRPYDYVLMFLANMADEGLTILPTHRMVAHVPPDFIDLASKYFLIETVSGHFRISETLAGRRHALGFFSGEPDRWHILTYKGGPLTEVPAALAGLDVTVLHELVLGRILKTSEFMYEMDITKCLNRVREGNAGGAFFLNPTRVEDVERVALASLRMPPKSTYFYPKLLTGVVINSFKN